MKLVNEEEIKERWKEYFSELLNRPDPDHPVGELLAGVGGEVDDEEELDKWTEAEIKTVIRKLKNNKAAGSDGIAAELIKEGGNILHDELVRQYD